MCLPEPALVIDTDSDTDGESRISYGDRGRPCEISGLISRGRFRGRKNIVEPLICFLFVLSEKVIIFVLVLSEAVIVIVVGKPWGKMTGCRIPRAINKGYYTGVKSEHLFHGVA